MDADMTGSFNFTKAAEENNAKNLLVIEDAKLAAQNAANWQRHLARSEAPHREAKKMTSLS
jgi:phosphatidylserine/phosphatidylglycerophosphate/cardiolipin synthase-like enzyme